MPTIQVTYKDLGKGVATIHVPYAELLILHVLSDEKLTAPQIVRRSEAKISLNGVYSLLKRLMGRGLINREEGSVQVLDISLRYIYYSRSFSDMTELD